MAELPDSLRCLFSAELEYRDGDYVLRVPEQELETGTLAAGTVYRVGAHERPAAADDGTDASTADTATTDGATPRREQSRQGRAEQSESRGSVAEALPVEEGERRRVTIEGVGDEGDGIAKIDRGYVLVVPGTEPGDEVEVEVTTVTPTVGFAEVVASDE